jgi:hypothetical protein
MTFYRRTVDRRNVRSFGDDIPEGRSVSTFDRPAVRKDRSGHLPSRPLCMIFYSWQSDRETQSGKKFIRIAAGDAARRARSR